LVGCPHELTPILFIYLLETILIEEFHEIFQLQLSLCRTIQPLEMVPIWNISFYIHRHIFNNAVTPCFPLSVGDGDDRWSILLGRAKLTWTRSWLLIPIAIFHNLLFLVYVFVTHCLVVSLYLDSDVLSRRLSMLHMCLIRMLLLLGYFWRYEFFILSLMITCVHVRVQRFIYPVLIVSHESVIWI
jgi:hypothetical protein